MDYPSGFVTLWEDFLLDNVSQSGALSNWLETVGSGTPATADITNRHGGWWRFTLGTNDADDIMLAGEVSWEVDEGSPLIYETRCRTSVAASTHIFAGMSDANTESSAIGVIHDEDGTLVTTADDAFGFMLEGERQIKWQAVSTQDNATHAQTTLSGSADAANDTDQVLRVVATTRDSGTAEYYVGTSLEFGGGKLVSTLTGSISSEVVYAPVIQANGRGSAVNVDFDYIFVQAPRS
jgi:hypothetical protein